MREKKERSLSSVATCASAIFGSHESGLRQNMQIYILPLCFSAILVSVVPALTTIDPTALWRIPLLSFAVHLMRELKLFGSC